MPEVVGPSESDAYRPMRRVARVPSDLTDLLRQGGCSVEELADVSRLAIATMASDASRPVVLFGSSSGGMLTSCLIPYLDDVVSSYVCHGVHNPAYARRAVSAVLRLGAEAVPGLR